MRPAFLLLSTSILALAASAHAVVIDDFTRGSLSLNTANGNNVSADDTDASALGGYRTSRLFSVSGTATASVSGGSGTWSNGGYSLFDLFYGQRAYPNGGVQGDIYSALSANLTGTTALRFTVSELTRPVRVYASLFSGYTSGALSNNIQGMPAFLISSPGTYDLPLSSLRTPSGTNPLNLADVDYINFDFQMFQGGTMKLARIEAVPEPASLAVLGLGAVAFVRRRRA